MKKKHFKNFPFVIVGVFVIAFLAGASALYAADEFDPTTSPRDMQRAADDAETRDAAWQQAKEYAERNQRLRQKEARGNQRIYDEQGKPYATDKEIEEEVKAGRVSPETAATYAQQREAARQKLYEEGDRLNAEQEALDRQIEQNSAARQDARDSVKPTIIPRPSALPGISIESQTQANELGVPGSGVRAMILDLIPNVLKGFLGFVAISSTVFLIVGGIRLLTAYGNEEALGEAKKNIIWAIIGLVIAILAYAIVYIIVRLPFPT